MSNGHEQEETPPRPAGDLQARIAKWREQLLDLSKRNRLINCRLAGRSVVLLEHPSAQEVWDSLVVENKTLTFAWKRELLGDDDGEAEVLLPEETNGVSRDPAKAPEDGEGTLEDCLESPELTELHLLTALSDKDLGRRLYRLALNAGASISEQGVNTLYLASGFLRYYESKDSDVALTAPLLLVPVQLKRATTDAPWQLSEYEEEVILNHSLAQLLASDFKVTLPELPDESLQEDAEAREKYLESVREAIQDNPRWEVEDHCALGVFSFQKLAMWADMGENKDHISAHPLCAAVGGDPGARMNDALPALPSARDHDYKILPKDTYHILAADSSQQEAILAAKAGYSFVLDGPPGTGKSQTIANIIAEFLAAGKKVLFVSEKSAALEVVKRRLDSCMLGDFCLECHSHKANKRQVLEELGRCLHLAMESYSDQSRRLEDLYAVRGRLNGYVNHLHEPQVPLGFTPFQVHGLLAAIRTTATTRYPIDQVLEVTPESLAECTGAIGRLSDYAIALAEYDTHPWRRTILKSYSLSLEGDVQHHFSVLAGELDRAAAQFSKLTSLGLCSESSSRNDMSQVLEVVRAALESPQVPVEWFGPGLPEKLGDPERLASARQTASAYVDLHEVSQGYRAEIGILTEYQDAAAMENHEALIKDFPVFCESALAKLWSSQANTVRQVLSWLPQAAGLSRTLQEHLNSAKLAVDTVVRLLGVPIITKLTLKRLPKLARLPDVISRIRIVRPTWFNPETRAIVKQLAGECAQRQQQIETLRLELSDRLSISAFAESAEAMVERSTAYQSFFGRLFRGWKTYKLHVLDFYKASGNLSTGSILSDLRKLRQFHQLRAANRAAALQYPNDIPCQANGDADWREVLAQVELVDEVAQVGQLPAVVIDALSKPGAIDQEAFAEEAERLKSAASELGGDVSRLQAFCSNQDLWTVFGLPPERQCLDEMLEVVVKLQTMLQGSQEYLTKVLELLRDTADPPLIRVVVDFMQLDRLRTRLARVTALGSQLGIQGEATFVAAEDWSGESAKGKWLLGLLNKYADMPPTPLLRISADAAFRAKVMEAAGDAARSLTPTLSDCWQFMGIIFDERQMVADGLSPLSSPVADIAVWLRERCKDVPRLREWLGLQELLANLKALGLERLCEEVLRKDLPLAEVEKAFMARFYRLWLDAVYQHRPALRGFDVQQHESLIKQFRELDTACVAGTYKRIRTKLLSDSARAMAFDGPDIGELGILRREVSKQRRHLPLRQLLKKTPQWLLRLKPCMMMSPLSVSTYLDTADIRFDVVIFDEASQVRPHDAICAIYRGKQVIVAGDPKQLPPTAFFDHISEDEAIDVSDDGEIEESISDFESILDVCSSLQLPRKRLKWHFRSKRESLIAFSNSHFYGNELVTFPSVFDTLRTSAVRLELVPNGVWKSGSSGGFNRPEACKTAELVFEHFSKHPAESLGVITMNIRQQLAVLEEIERLRRERPDYETFFDEERHEQFFVKNLENVQGDERDRIIISIGYGPDAAGKMSMRFGPLNNLGGERRLNVAITRSRSGIIVVSSIRSHDIDLTRTNSVGARLLRSYLDYAERGAEALAAEITEAGERDFDSPFEAEVARALASRGLGVHKQVGCSGFRIDLAIVHPERSGQYVLGVECDGATYHSSATARDRDRLRQEILESLGWRICRVWSTDWIRSPDGQIKKIVDEYTKAVQSPMPTMVETRPAPIDLERPRIRAPKNNGSEDYAKIADVPREEIERIILELLGACGQTDEEELLVGVARKLGFQRLGSRIKQAAKAAITRLIRSRRIVRQDDRKLQLLQ